MQKTLLIAITLFGTFSVSGCASNTLDKTKTSDNKEISIPKAESPLLVELLDKCPYSGAAESREAFPILIPLLGAVATVVIPPVINYGISATANWLDERALGRSASSTGSSTDQLWKKDPSGNIVPKHGCLMIVRGQFDDSGAPLKNPPSDLEGTPWNEEDTKEINKAIDNRSIEKKRKLTLLGYPEIYIAAPITYSRKEVTYKEGEKLKKIPFPDSFSIELGTVHYLKSGAKSGSDKEKKLVIEIGASAMVLNEGKKENVTLINATYDLGQVKIGGREIPKQQLQIKDKLTTALPGPFEENIPILLEGKRQINGKSLNLVDTKFTVVITETEDGGDVERGIAKGLRDNSSAFSEMILKFVNDAIEKQFGKSGAGVAR